MSGAARTADIGAEKGRIIQMSEKRSEKVRRRKARMGKKQKRLREAKRLRRAAVRQDDFAAVFGPDLGSNLSSGASLVLGLGTVMAAGLGENMRLEKLIHGKVG